MLKSERVCQLSENSDTNVSQVHSQVSADKQQPESLLQELSEGTSTDVNEMQFFTDVSSVISVFQRVTTWSKHLNIPSFRYKSANTQ